MYWLDHDYSDVAWIIVSLNSNIIVDKNYSLRKSVIHSYFLKNYVSKW